MSRLSKLCARFLGDRGFSIGVEDVTPNPRMVHLKTTLISEGQRLAQEQIQAYKSGRIRLKPGCDALQSLESEVNGLLGRLRVGNISGYTDIAININRYSQYPLLLSFLFNNTSINNTHVKSPLPPSR